MSDYSLILKIKYPNIRYAITDNDYKTIIWDNKITYKPTKEELDSQWEEVLSIIQKDKCKTQAQILLNESDWSDLYNVRNKLENIDEWDSYRDIIRELRINPIENPVFPDKPKTIWKEIIPTPIEETIVAQEEPIQEEIVSPTDELIVNEESAI